MDERLEHPSHGRKVLQVRYPCAAVYFTPPPSYLPKLTQVFNRVHQLLEGLKREDRDGKLEVIFAMTQRLQKFFFNLWHVQKIILSALDMTGVFFFRNLRVGGVRNRDSSGTQTIPAVVRLC